MTWASAAVAGGSAVLGFLGSNKESKAAKYAAQLQYQQAQDTIKREQPFTDIGLQALQHLQDYYNKPGKAVDALNAMPGYQAGMDAMGRTVSRQAAAGGNFGGGTFGVDLASLGMKFGMEAQNQNFNQLMTMGNMGQASASNQANYGMQGAQALGAGSLLTANAFQQQVGGLANLAGRGYFDPMFKNIFGGGNNTPDPIPGNYPSLSGLDSLGGGSPFNGSGPMASFGGGY